MQTSESQPISRRDFLKLSGFSLGMLGLGRWFADHTPALAAQNSVRCDNATLDTQVARAIYECESGEDDPRQAIIDAFTPEAIRTLPDAVLDTHNLAYRRQREDGRWEYWRPHNALDQENDLETGWVTQQAELVNPDTGHRLLIEMNEERMAERHPHPIQSVEPVPTAQEEFIRWDSAFGATSPPGTIIAVQLIPDNPGYSNPDVGDVITADFSLGIDQPLEVFYLMRVYDGSSGHQSELVSFRIADGLTVITEGVVGQSASRIRRTLIDNRGHVTVAAMTHSDALLGEDDRIVVVN